MAERKVPQYSISDSKGVDFVSEQLGLNLYLDIEESPKVLEIPKSEHPRISFLNDIVLNQWKEYQEIMTDSLWLLWSRDKTSVHTAELHGL